MRILIIGATGYLGSYLYDSFKLKYSVEGTSRNPDNDFTHLNLSSPADILQFLSKNRYDYIINAAGNASPDRCETDKKYAFRTNFLTHYNLLNAIKLSKQTSIVIFISSIYVFGCPNKAIFYTRDPICPSNYYGQTKALAEYIGMTQSDYHITLRLPLLFGNPLHPRDPIAQLLTTNDEIHLDNKEIRYPTSLQHISNCLQIILNENLSGIFNISGHTPVTRFSMINRARTILGYDCDTLHDDGIYPDPLLWKKIAYRPQHLRIKQSEAFELSPEYDEEIRAFYSDSFTGGTA